jgi:microcystin degradation protein MlrC
MRSVMEKALAIQARPGLLNVTVSGGFAYADIPQPGISVVAVTDNDAPAAQQYAEGLAREIWKARDQLVGNWPAPSEAIRMALHAKRTPVILVDIGDNIGGGTPGDGTALLSKLLEERATGAVVMLWDPIAVQQCLGVGEGADVRIVVGGRSDTVYGPGCPVRGRVGKITDGRFEAGTPLHKGFGTSMGLTVRVDVSDNRVVLTSRSTVPWSLGQLRSVGIEPRACRIIVVKAAIAHRLAYGPIGGTFIECNTPGWTTPNLARLPYRRLRRPLWPFDTGLSWP